MSSHLYFSTLLIATAIQLGTCRYVLARAGCGVANRYEHWMMTLVAALGVAMVPMWTLEVPHRVIFAQALAFGVAGSFSVLAIWQKSAFLAGFPALLALRWIWELVATDLITQQWLLAGYPIRLADLLYIAIGVGLSFCAATVDTWKFGQPK